MVHSDGLRPILIFLKYKMFFQQYYKIIEGEETILFLRCIEYTLKKRNAKQIARVFFFFFPVRVYVQLYTVCSLVPRPVFYQNSYAYKTGRVCNEYAMRPLTHIFI